MDTARYYVALFVVASCPGVYLFWFWIHPFVGFWRRIGARTTLSIHISIVALIAAGVVLIREPLLSVEFGTRPVLLVLSGLCFGLSVFLRRQISGQVGISFLLGLPELAPETYGSTLVTTGIYSRIRHPRYVQLLLVILAYALFSNYLAAYVVFALGIVWIHSVARIEEIELRARFGEDYGEYCQRVPRFLPRRRRRDERE